MSVLDLLDRRLIALLRSDGRAPLAQVAAALHVSRVSNTETNILLRTSDGGTRHTERT